MRASTFFLLALAVLIGLGTAVALKASGYWEKPAPPPREPMPAVLVAAANIYEGSHIHSGDVRVRPLRPDEVEHYKAYRDQYLPPVVNAAIRRVARVNIPVDKPILKEDLEELRPPTALEVRITPGMRAVHVAVLKEQCAGGLIEVDDLVEVYLTTDVTRPDGASVTRTGAIARYVRVIAKRNSLVPVATPLGTGCPVNFTLEANPYRAAVIEFAKDKGYLSLIPISEADKTEYRKAARKGYAIPGSAEYRDEDQRVAQFLNGELIVSEADLARILDVKYTPAPAPVMVERYSGLHAQGYYVFGPGGTFMTHEQVRAGMPQAPAASASGQAVRTAGYFNFRPPSQGARCPTCPGTRR